MQRHHARVHSSKKQRVADSEIVEYGIDHCTNNAALAPSDDMVFTTDSTDVDPWLNTILDDSQYFTDAATSSL
jgi:hypothetical protein